MGIVGEDGHGTANKWKIDAEGRLGTRATSVPEEHHVNEESQKTWTVPFDAIDPTNSTSLFMALNNTAEAIRVIPRVVITSTIAGYVQFVALTGAIGAGTTIAPLSRTIGGAGPANFSAQSGVDLTGLTLGGVHRHIYLQANVEREVEFPATVRMVQNTLLGFRASTTGIFTGNVDIYEED